jgi:hypothetical protein
MMLTWIEQLRIILKIILQLVDTTHQAMEVVLMMCSGVIRSIIREPFLILCIDHITGCIVHLLIVLITALTVHSIDLGVLEYQSTLPSVSDRDGVDIMIPSSMVVDLAMDTVMEVLMGGMVMDLVQPGVLLPITVDSIIP